MYVPLKVLASYDPFCQPDKKGTGLYRPLQFAAPKESDNCKWIQLSLECVVVGMFAVIKFSYSTWAILSASKTPLYGVNCSSVELAETLALADRVVVDF